MDSTGEPAQRIAMSLSRVRKPSREGAVRVRRSPRRRSCFHPGGAGELAGKEQERTTVGCQCVSSHGDRSGAGRWGTKSRSYWGRRDLWEDEGGVAREGSRGEGAEGITWSEWQGGTT